METLGSPDPDENPPSEVMPEEEDLFSPGEYHDPDLNPLIRPLDPDDTPVPPTQVPNDSDASNEHIEQDDVADETTNETFKGGIIIYSKLTFLALRRRLAQRRIDRASEQARLAVEHQDVLDRAEDLARLPYSRLEEPDEGFTHTRKIGETLGAFRARTGQITPTRIQSRIPPEPNGKKIFKEEILPNKAMRQEYGLATTRLRKRRRGSVVRIKGSDIHGEGVDLRASGSENLHSTSIPRIVKGVSQKVKGGFRSVRGMVLERKGVKQMSKASSIKHRERLERQRKLFVGKLKESAYREVLLSQRIRSLRNGEPYEPTRLARIVKGAGSIASRTTARGVRLVATGAKKGAEVVAIGSIEAGRAAHRHFIERPIQEYRDALTSDPETRSEKVAGWAGRKAGRATAKVRKKLKRKKT